MSKSPAQLAFKEQIHPGKQRVSQYLLPTTIMIVVFYLNTASILQSARLHIHLPRPRAAEELFRMFSLFSHYTKYNYGFECEGRESEIADASGEPKWIEINLYEYFPQTRGEANRRLNLHSVGTDNQAKRQRDYARMAEVIKLRHNRTHPQAQIHQLRIYFVNWPKSTLGYGHEYKKRTRKLIYQED